MLLCAEILQIPALDAVMPEQFGPGELPPLAGVGAVADQWLHPADAAVDAGQREHLSSLVLLAASLILLPYLWSAAYQVLLAVKGRRMSPVRGVPRSDHRRRRIGLYAVWLVYAGGTEYPC